MKIGRSHKWHYDRTPYEWEFNYGVTKRRAGRAPEGSGVPIGTEYHWYILAHQHVRKLNANDYTTAMSGLKIKLAHKRYNTRGITRKAECGRKSPAKKAYQDP